MKSLEKLEMIRTQVIPNNVSKYNKYDILGALFRLSLRAPDRSIRCFFEILYFIKILAIPLMKEGRLFGQFWSVYVSCKTNFKDAVDWGLQQLDITREYVDMYPEFELVNDPWSAKKAMNNGKIASTMGLEGGHMIGSRLAILRQLFNLGIRYMTLTHNCNTPWADNNIADVNEAEVRNNGLSDFGKDVILEMNRIGMFVDLSHVSTATMNDALDVSEAPVMFRRVSF